MKVYGKIPRRVLAYILATALMVTSVAVISFGIDDTYSSGDEPSYESKSLSDDSSSEPPAEPEADDTLEPESEPGTEPEVDDDGAGDSELGIGDSAPGADSGIVTPPDGDGIPGIDYPNHDQYPPIVDELESSLTFSFSEDLILSPSSFAEAGGHSARRMILLRGLTLTDESGTRLNVNIVTIEDEGGFRITADPGSEFLITYSAEHPVSGEIFTTQRLVIVVADEEDEYDGGASDEEYPDEGYEIEEDEEEYLETDVNFTFRGSIIVDIRDLHGDLDIYAFLLSGVRAYDEHGESLTHLLTVIDDGGFESYVRRNFSHITEDGGLGSFPLPSAGLPFVDFDPFFGFGDMMFEILFNEEGEIVDVENVDGLEFAFETEILYGIRHPVSEQTFVSEPRHLGVDFTEFMADILFRLQEMQASPEIYGIINPRLGRIVWFDPNGGDPMPPGNEFRMTQGTSDTISAGNMPVQPRREGFAFRHWNTEPVLAPGEVGTVFTGLTVVPPGGMTVYAQWGRQISFNANAPDVTLNVGDNQNNTMHFTPRIVPQNSSVYQTPNIVWPLGPAGVANQFIPDNPNLRYGFTFLGWYDTWYPTGGNRFDQHTVITDNVDLYARWRINPVFTINFQPRGGTVSGQATREVRGGSSIAMSSAYPFHLNAGLSHLPTASRVREPGGAGSAFPFNNNLANPTTAITFVRWSPQPYGRSLAVGPPTGTPTYFIATSVVTNEWVEADANSPYSPSSGLIRDPLNNNEVIGGSMNVFAHWRYNISFNSTGGSAVSARHVTIPANGVATIAQHGISSAFPFNSSTGSLTTPTRGAIGDGGQREWEFIGWYNMRIDDNTADASLPAGAVRFSTTTEINSSGTLYARWRTNPNWAPATYVTITFDRQGGDWPATHSTELGTRTVRQGTSIWTSLGSSTQPNLGFPRMPVRDNYIFMGWFPNSNGTGAILRDTTAIQNDITYYAHWEPYFTVIISANGGNPATNRVRRVAQGRTFAQMHNVYGSTASWYGSPEGNMYNLTNVPSGSGAEGINAATTRANHTFALWNTQADGFGSRFVNTIPVTSDMTIYAMWAPWITFNNNHHSVNPLVQNSTFQVNTILSGRSINTTPAHPNATVGVIGNNLPALPTIAIWPSLFIPDRAFVGWNRQSDGQGAWFDHTTIVNEPPFTVYAIWSLGVAFNPGLAPASAIQAGDRERFIIFGDSLGANMPDPPNWTNHTFVDWSTEPTGAGITVRSDTPIPGPWTLYARWRADVNFYVNTPDPIAVFTGPFVTTLDIGDPLGTDRMPSPPTRTSATSNWTFAGWNDAANGGGQMFTAAAPNVPSGITLYAQWNGEILFMLNAVGTGATWPGGGSAVRPHVVRDGRFVSSPMPGMLGEMPPNPIRGTDDFLGWSTSPTNAAGSTFFSAGTDIQMLTGDMTLHPVWGSSEQTLTLNIVGGEWGTVAVNSTGATPPSITANNATMLVAPGNSVTAALTLNTGLDPAWFTVTAQLQQTTPAPPGTSVTLTPVSPGNFQFDMPNGDATITITFAPRNELLFNTIGMDNLFYGTHAPTFFVRPPIRLSYGFIHGGGTNPANVRLEVLNGTSSNWHIMVSAAAHNGSTALASRLVVGNQTINGAAALVYQHTHTLSSPVIYPVQWTALETANRDVAVRMHPGDIVLQNNTYAAVLDWNLISGSP